MSCLEVRSRREWRLESRLLVCRDRKISNFPRTFFCPHTWESLSGKKGIIHLRASVYYRQGEKKKARSRSPWLNFVRKVSIRSHSVPGRRILNYPSKRVRSDDGITGKEFSFISISIQSFSSLSPTSLSSSTISSWSPALMEAINRNRKLKLSQISSQAQITKRGGDGEEALLMRKPQNSSDFLSNFPWWLGDPLSPTPSQTRAVGSLTLMCGLTQPFHQDIILAQLCLNEPQIGSDPKES